MPAAPASPPPAVSRAAVASDAAVPVTVNGRGPVPVSYSPTGRHRVVVIGGGFAGLNCVRGLRNADVDVTLVDRRNHHLFQPLLYQVATGSLSPANIAAPLRGVLDDQPNCRVLLGEAVDVDVDRRVVVLSGDQNPTTGGGPEDELEYDTLVVAAGSTHSYFGRDEWAPFAPGLKTIEDAIEIRRRILIAFEEAEREPDREKQKQWLTFVLVGGGPTGVELAGSIAEIARRTLKSEFRTIHPEDARIVIADGGGRVLGAYDEELSRYAARDLGDLGVTIHNDTRVTDVSATHVVLTPEKGGDDWTLPCRTVIWCAGVKASGLGEKLAAATDAGADRAGRVEVERNLALAGRPEIFVLGDLANFAHAPEESGDGEADSEGGWGKETQGAGDAEHLNSGRPAKADPLPGVAQVAMQQGKHCAKQIRRRLSGEPDVPFRYRDLGTMAVIGRGSAVADLFGKYHATGAVAWLMWLAIHVMYIVGFQSRILVLIQWFVHYVTFDRGARLITGQTLPVATTLGEGGDPADDDRPGDDESPADEPANRLASAPDRHLGNGRGTIPGADRTPVPAGSAAVGAET